MEPRPAAPPAPGSLPSLIVSGASAGLPPDQCCFSDVYVEAFMVVFPPLVGGVSRGAFRPGAAFTRQLAGALRDRVRDSVPQVESQADDKLLSAAMRGARWSMRRLLALRRARSAAGKSRRASTSHSSVLDLVPPPPS
eukprot:GHVT01086666.1.p2 GENE.GHVT01086666.1~~GHVT01086666.1.p2  ORF type:complete len:138 (-),score=18.76 GHVT01086666.1:798-1211(-)